MDEGRETEVSLVRIRCGTGAAKGDAWLDEREEAKGDREKRRETERGEWDGGVEENGKESCSENARRSDGVASLELDSTIEMKTFSYRKNWAISVNQVD